MSIPQFWPTWDVFDTQKKRKLLFSQRYLFTVLCFLSLAFSFYNKPYESPTHNITFFGYKYKWANIKAFIFIEWIQNGLSWKKLLLHCNENFCANTHSFYSVLVSGEHSPFQLLFQHERILCLRGKWKDSLRYFYAILFYSASSRFHMKTYSFQ